MEVRRGYKQTEVGVIPEQWEATTIGDVTRFSGGSQPPKSTFKRAPANGFIRLIQIRDYKTDEHAVYIPEAMARKQCTAQDIMIGRYGPPIFQILRGIEGAYNVALIKAEPNSKIDREFLFNILRQEKLFQLIDSLSRRSSGQTGVEMPALKSYGLALPPLPEQQTIAAALSDVDAFLSGLEQLIVKKRDLKQAAVQQLLTGQTRLHGFNGEWGTWSLRRFVKQFIVPMRDKPKALSGDIPWCRIEDFDGMYLTGSKSGQGVDVETVRAMNLKVYPVGTLLVSCSADLGHCAIVAKPLVSNQTFIGLEVDVSIASNVFFYYLMSSMAPELNNLSSGTTISYLPREKFEDLAVFVPNEKAEQVAIATILADMDAELSAVEARRDKTRALKQAMMQELLSGKTRLVPIGDTECLNSLVPNATRRIA